MPIKEEPVVINFRYEPVSDGRIDVGLAEVFYNVQFHTEEGMSLITIEMTNGDAVSLPAELLVETVDFLRQKGAIKFNNGMKVGTPSQPMVKYGNPGISGLPIPQITKKDGSVVTPTVTAIETEPFVSFAPSAVDIIKQAEANSVINPVPIQPVAPVAIPTDAFKRPVIRSRIRDEEDPLGAEKEAAVIRGSSGRVIRRKDE